MFACPLAVLAHVVVIRVIVIMVFIVLVFEVADAANGCIIHRCRAPKRFRRHCVLGGRRLAHLMFLGPQVCVIKNAIKRLANAGLLVGACYQWLTWHVS